jgi:hypothetical protein
MKLKDMKLHMKLHGENNKLYTHDKIVDWVNNSQQFLVSTVPPVADTRNTDDSNQPKLTYAQAVKSATPLDCLCKKFVSKWF